MSSTAKAGGIKLSSSSVSGHYKTRFILNKGNICQPTNSNVKHAAIILNLP